MILNGCTSVAGYVCMPNKTCNPKYYSSVSAGIPRMPNMVVFSCSRSSWEPNSNLISCSSKGGLSHNIPKLTSNRGLLPFTSRALKDISFSYRSPATAEKPKWWWRSLACLPYLIPFRLTWFCAMRSYHLHPFLEEFEFLTYRFLQLPSWFPMVYFFVAYLGVVKKKEGPHYFRFHVMMGMFLGLALQIIVTTNRWMPFSDHSKIGMLFWTTFTFANLLAILECIRCALTGVCAEVPFVSDAAYMQVPK